MALEKTEALILRVILFRETSKVVTAYTAERGLVSLLAKGVRGPKPRFGAALELFAHVDLVYYHRDSRELQLVSEATLLDPYLRLSREAVRYAYGVGVLEFLLKVLQGQEVPGKLYTLSLRTLEVLETCPREALAGVFRAFEIKAVSFLGHRPELFICVECGRQADREPGADFSPRLGGVVCVICSEHVSDALVLSPGLWTLMRRLLTRTLAEVETDPPSVAAVNGVGRLIEPFLQAHLERYEALRAVRMAGTLETDRNVVKK
jgi:DNA repair protein RecO (recombination protein O)